MGQKKYLLKELKLIVVLSSIVFVISNCVSKASSNPQKGEDLTKIEQVENGLLPPVLIEGEQPYTLSERMSHYKVPGISIAVIKDFKIQWVKHYGVMDRDTKEPVTNKTMFGVGSLSKAVAAMVILKKVEEGKLILDGSVNDQLVSWKIPENEFTDKTQVTVRHLLSHSGGLNMSYGTAGYTADKMPTLIQIINGEKPAMTEAVRIENEPGTAFRYSNHGYAVLQQLLIDIENKPFPEIVRETVFNPLGMVQSTFEQPLPQKWLPFAASGHRRDRPPISINRLYTPRMAAGGLWTTATDLAKFTIELQLSLHNKSNKVLSTDMVQEMFTPVVSENYGLGIGISKMDDEIYLSFFGDIAGFFAGFIWHKTDGYGAVIVSNSSNGLELEREIFRSIANVYGWKGYLPQQYEIMEVERELLEKYTGRYLIGSDNVLTVSLENNVMYMQTSETDRVKLFPVARDKFVLKERKGELVFIQDSSGAVVKAVHQFTYLLDQFASQKFTSKRLPGDYKIPLELLLEGKIKDAMEEYQKIKATNPDDPYISEGRFNMLGYSFIYQGKLQQAITVFKINVDLYPESWNVYDSLGEVYMLNGDTELAIKNYEKSLELNPSSAGAIEKLKKLKEK